ncbi:MAG: von Willebrand factor type A domain-containing protein [Kofleriaceae bacterium]
MSWNMDDPRWTAYVLGELDDGDRAELAAVLEADADARAYVESLREAIGVIETELAALPAPALDELQRQRIQKAAVKPRYRTAWWIAGGVAAASVALVTFATVASQSQQDSVLRVSTNTADSGSGSAMRAHDALDGRLSERDLQLAEHGRDQGLAFRTTNGPAIQGIMPRIPDTRVSGDSEAYGRIDDNPFFMTGKDPLSTFSIDVDTAAYANVRRFLAEGTRPPKDAVRVEEMINYFRYDYPLPERGEPFSITTEAGPSPWNAKYQLVRVGLRAPAIDDAQVPARNLVFLIDTSGSMQQHNKLPLLQQSLGLLVEQLRPQDTVAMVTYAGSAGVVLLPTSGRDKDAIRTALARLEAGGSTAGAAGIQLAYEVAARAFIKAGINRVILCSDGDYNVGLTSEGDLTRLIETERKRGVFLTVLGFGMGNLKDSTMEKLADRGNGNYAYIDSVFEARKVLVREAGATLVTVAKDVKLQVEFNPAKVAGYRLIGYENRLLQHQDFNDDTKDAGEIGAGHTVTALYEIVPAGVAVPAASTDDLKYTKPGPAAGTSDEWMTVKVRYKAPAGDTSKLLSRVVLGSAARSQLAETSTDFRFAAAIAGFGMLLRESPYRGNLSWQQVHALAEGALGSDAEGYRKQALALITAASRLPSPSP